MWWHGGVQRGDVEPPRLAAAAPQHPGVTAPAWEGFTKRVGFTPGALRHVLRSRALELPSEEGQHGEGSGGSICLLSCRRSPSDTAPPGRRLAAGARQAD